MKKFKILIPVYNDWQSLSKLLYNIDNEIKNLNHEISMIIVDDASTFDRQLDIDDLSNIYSIKILSMKENRGHARCIAAGLKYIFEKEEFDYVIPMDGDGEDRPEEIKNFLHNPTQSKNTQNSVINLLTEKLGFSKNLKNFFLLFIEKRRIFFVKKISESFL